MQACSGSRMNPGLHIQLPLESSSFEVSFTHLQEYFKTLPCTSHCLPPTQVAAIISVWLAIISVWLYIQGFLQLNEHVVSGFTLASLTHFNDFDFKGKCWTKCDTAQALGWQEPVGCQGWGLKRVMLRSSLAWSV